LAILIPSSRFRYISRLAAGKVYLTLLLVRTQLDAESNATFSNGDEEARSGWAIEMPAAQLPAH